MLACSTISTTFYQVPTTGQDDTKYVRKKISCNPRVTLKAKNHPILQVRSLSFGEPQLNVK